MWPTEAPWGSVPMLIRVFVFVLKDFDLWGAASSSLPADFVLVLIVRVFARKALSLPAVSRGLATEATDGSRADGLSRRAAGGGGGAVPCGLPLMWLTKGPRNPYFPLTESFAAFAVVNTHFVAGTVNEDCEHHISH